MSIGRAGQALSLSSLPLSLFLPLWENRKIGVHFNFPLAWQTSPVPVPVAATSAMLDLVFLFTLKAVCIHLKG